MDGTRQWRLGGLVAGLSIAYLLSRNGLAAWGPLALAVCLAVGVLAGEVLLPRPEPVSYARASLEVRRIRDFVPAPAPWASILLLVSASVIGQLSVLGFLAGSIRPGPPLFPAADRVGFVDVLVSSAVTLVGGLTVAVAVLATIVRSPRRIGDADHRWRDEEWRHRNVSAIVAAAGVFVSAVAAGLAMSTTPAPAEPAGVLLDVLLTLALTGALIAFSLFTSVLLRPAPTAHRASAPVRSPALPTVRVVPGELARRGEPPRSRVVARAAVPRPSKPVDPPPAPEEPAGSRAPEPPTNPDREGRPASAASSVTSGEMPAIAR